MAEPSEDYSSSKEAIDDFSLTAPAGNCCNDGDGYRTTKLKAIRKRSVDPKSSSNKDEKELNTDENITSEKTITTGARFAGVRFAALKNFRRCVNHEQDHHSGQ